FGEQREPDPGAEPVELGEVVDDVAPEPDRRPLVPAPEEEDRHLTHAEIVEDCARHDLGIPEPAVRLALHHDAGRRLPTEELAPGLAVPDPPTHDPVEDPAVYPGQEHAVPGERLAQQVVPVSRGDVDAVAVDERDEGGNVVRSDLQVDVEKARDPSAL